MPLDSCLCQPKTFLQRQGQPAYEATAGEGPFPCLQALQGKLLFPFFLQIQLCELHFSVSTAAAIGLSFLCLGTCLILDTLIAKPVERGALSGEVTCSLCHLVTKANIPPTYPFTKSKMLQLTHCL